MLAATCTNCGVYQLLWLGLVTNLTRTPHGHRVRYVCPRCGAANSIEFAPDRRRLRVVEEWRRGATRVRPAPPTTARRRPAAITASGSNLAR